MPGERDLLGRREDPDARVPTLFRREDEHGLRQVRLARELLHPFRLDVAPVGEDGDRIPRERRVGEDVADDVAEVHVATLRREGLGEPGGSPSYLFVRRG